MQDKEKYTAVVPLSEFHENPSNAIKSIVATKACFEHVVIVDLAHEEGKQYYDDYQDDVQVLLDSEISVSIVKELDVSEDLVVPSQYIVTVPPYCSFKRASIDTLTQSIKTSNADVTDFSVASATKLETPSLWYGFFIVTAFWYFIWDRWEQHKMWQSQTDISARAIIKQGRHKHLSKWRIWNYIWNPFVAPRHTPRDQTIALMKPNDDRAGFAYLWSYLHKDERLGVSWFYWIPYFRPWCWFFLVYWVVTIIAVFECIKFPLAIFGWAIGTPGAIGAISGTFTLLIFIGSVINFLIALIASAISYSFPFQIHMMLFYPLYVVLFPFVLLYARLVKPKEHW